MWEWEKQKGVEVLLPSSVVVSDTGDQSAPRTNYIERSPLAHMMKHILLHIFPLPFALSILLCGFVAWGSAATPDDSLASASQLQNLMMSKGVSISLEEATALLEKGYREAEALDTAGSSFGFLSIVWSLTLMGTGFALSGLGVWLSYTVFSSNIPGGKHFQFGGAILSVFGVTLLYYVFTSLLTTWSLRLWICVPIFIGIVILGYIL